MKRLRGYAIAALVAAVAAAAVTANGGFATRDVSSANTRSVYVRTGDLVSFQGLGWTCMLAVAPDPAGVLRGPSGERPRLFCRYQVNDGGCPYVALANPYMWFGGVRARPPIRTRTGAHYVRTHYGCD